MLSCLLIPTSEIAVFAFGICLHFFFGTLAIYLLLCSAGGDSTWIISAEDRAKHNAQFEQLKPVNGFVTGIENLSAH